MKGRRMYDDGGKVANTILDQLGGAGRLRAMTGAYNFYDIGNGLSFKIKNARANYIKIKLTSMDLYDVEVGRIRGNTYKVVDSAQGLYFDQLKPFIEKATGMYLSLYGKGGMIEHKTDDGKILKYKIDENEMSVEVDFPTMEYLSDYGIVMKKEARKLKDTYIFWYDEINSASKEELEETLKVELPLYQRGYDEDDERDDYDDYARGGELSDSAYKKRMKMFGHKPYGKTKGKFKITYNADGEPQSEIRETLEMAKDSAKRYSRIDDFSDVKIFDESGNEIEFMADGGRVYKLGDRWKDDFDYNGMLRMGLKAKTSWGSKKLRKLYDSYEDVNYHKVSTNLWNAIQSIQKSEEVQSKEAKDAYILAADNYIERFHDDILEDMLSEMEAPASKPEPINLREVYLELKSKVYGLRLNEENENEILADVRDWGNWEHDYSDDERDEEDFEDDDFMVLSDDSYKKMSEIVKEIKSKYPDVSINWSTSEKNYIDFEIIRKDKMEDGGNVPTPYKVNVYGRMTSKDYYGVDSKSTALKWFKLNGKPMTRARAEQFAKSYIERLGRSNVHIGGMEYGGMGKGSRRFTSNLGYEDGGQIDLFEEIESLPDEVQNIIQKYSSEDETYGNLEDFLSELQPLGYTFEYGLDAVPYDLRKMADGGIMANGGYFEMEEEEDEVDYNSISYLEDELRRLVRWSNEYGSKGADAKIEQLRKRIEYLKTQNADGGRMAKGGKVKKRVRFVDKVESIADRLEGTKVPKRLKKDYGGKYNREEAEEAARRIAGAQLRDRKM